MKHISVLHQANECLDLHSDISSGAEVHSLPPRSPKSSKTSAFACRSSLTCLSIRQMGFSSTINLYMMFRYQHLMTMRSMIMQMTPMTPEFQDPTYRSLMHLRVRASMQNTFPSSSHRHLDRTGVSGMVSRHLQSKSLSSATLRQWLCTWHSPCFGIQIRPIPNSGQKCQNTANQDTCLDCHSECWHHCPSTCPELQHGQGCLSQSPGYIWNLSGVTPTSCHRSPGQYSYSWSSTGRATEYTASLDLELWDIWQRRWNMDGWV